MIDMPRKAFPLLRRRQQFRSYYTILDIGTEVIKALVVKREDDKGIVVGVGKVRQATTDMQAGAVADIQSVIDNCDRALTEAEDMSDVIPGQVIMGIAGEQVRGFTTTASFPRAQPQGRITQAELTTALQAVERRAMQDAVRQMSFEMGVSELNVKLVHSIVTAVSIDGYPVSNPLDFQGRVVDVSVFNTFAPLTHIGALQTIAQELDLEMVAAVAEPYALARACATDDIYEMGGIFIDVGGGTTDIALVRKGCVESTRMFALGGRSFTSRIATELKMNLDEAERFKIAHGEGRLPADQRALVRRAVGPNAEVLAQGVALTLEELAHDDELPGAIYLAGGGAALPEVVEQLSAIDWKEQLPFTRQPTVSVLTPENVKSVYDTTGLLVGCQDVTPMGLASHAIALEEDTEHPLGGLMRRVIKSMKV